MKMHLLISGLALLAVVSETRAADNRVSLAQQNDFERNRGFSLNLENSGAEEPLRLSNLKVVLAIGDGKGWRYLEKAPLWDWGKEYTLEAVISPESARISRDGVLLGESQGPFVPAAARADSFRTPTWASSPAEYLVSETSLSLRTDSGRRFGTRWPAQKPDGVALRLFDPQSPRRFDWTTLPGETLTVTAKVRFTKRPNIRTLAPFVDRYGQPIHAKFSDKVKTDADLTAAVADETSRMRKWALPAGRDPFGGDKGAGWTGTKTGYYSVTKRDGFWWMLSPEGNPLFYVGVCTVDRAAWERTPVTGREFLFAELPPRVGEYEQAWTKNPWGWDDNVDYVSFFTANLVRKYGSDWYAKTDGVIKRRLDAWGFSGAAKWSDSTLTNVPNIAVIYYPGVPTLAAHPDVFDPTVQATFREVLRKQIEPRKNDPWLVGWSVGNERDETILKGEITGILSKPSSPAKRAIIDACLDKAYGGDVAAAAKAWNVSADTRDALYASTPAPGDADIESMRHTFAHRYYGFLYETVKSLDPNHLYFGFWVVPWWWENQSDWALAAAHCDVLGYDLYSETFADADMQRWMTETDKPIFCGEFSYPPFEDGRRGLGVYPTVSATDRRDAAEHYRRWIHDASANPYCVGTGYFQYRDQPVTGRGPGGGANLVAGEHYAFGLVDITDKPKWDFIDSVRIANLAATATRLASNHPPVGQPGGDLPNTE